MTANQSDEMNGLENVDVEVVIELGRTRMSIDHLMNIVEGSLIEIPKVSGEPVDIKIEAETVAKGEVIVVEENFGARITQIERGD